MGRWRRALTSTPAIAAVGIFALYLLVGYFLVGPSVRWALPRYAQDELGSNASVAQVKFDPLRLSLRVIGLRLTQPDGALLAACSQFYARLEWNSLLRFAWHLGEVDVDGLDVRLAVGKDGSFNWNTLLAALRKGKSAPSKSVPRIQVSRLRLADSRIEYVDASRAKPFAAGLNPINLELNDLSTLPRDTGGYLLSAKLPGQGTMLKWSGRIGLNPLFSQGRAALENLDIVRASQAVELPEGWVVKGGTLNVSANYVFQTPQGRPDLQISDLRLALAQLAVALGHGVQLSLAQARIDQGGYDTRYGRAGWNSLDLAGLRLAQPGTPLLQLERARAGGLNVNLKEHRVRLDTLVFAGGEADAGIDAAGRLDWTNAIGSKADEHPAIDRAATARRQSKPWKITLKSVDLSGIDARFTDKRFVQPLLLVAHGLHLTASAAGEFGGAQSALSVKDLATGSGPLRVQSGSTEVASIGAIDMTGGQFDLAQREFSAGSLTIDQPAVHVVREKNGMLNWQAYLKEHPEQATGKAGSHEAGAANAGPPARFSLARLEVQGARITLEDLTPPRPVRLDLTDGHLVLANLSQDWKHPLPLSLALRVGGSGELTAEGRLVPAQGRGMAQLRLVGMPLGPFAPYVNQFARLRLTSGSVSTSGRLAFAAHGRPVASYRGSFAVDKLAIAEEDSGEPFLGWRSLRGRGLDLNFDPSRLNLRELVADQPFGKIIINPDKSVNLKNVLRPQAKATAHESAAKSEASAAGAPATGAAFPISVRQILIRRGDLQFADLSLKPQFGARIEDLGGAISGLSSRPEASAQVELDGRVGRYGSAQVRGRLQPFAATDNTDLTLKFRNLEMNPLSPYSGKFAGRLIDSGRLSVDLQYKIKHRELAGTNRFVMSQLKLGPPVESPDAVKLPLDLAIALLQNSQGIIDVDIPISGNLDDPKFSYGHLIWQAIVNLLTKIVTSPFRALGALLGVDSAKFGAIDFPYGEAILTPPQIDKLDQVGEALGKRPNLELVVAPTFDPERDVAALQEMALRRDVAEGLRLSVPAGTRPPPIDVHDRVTRLVLEDLYDKAFPGGISALRAEIQPRDIAALYQEAVQRLEKHIVIPQSQLQELARARAQAVVDQMKQVGGMAGRVAMGQDYAKVESEAPELAIKLDVKPRQAVSPSGAASPQGASNLHPAP